MPSNLPPSSADRSRSNGSSGRDIQAALSSSFRSASPLAAEALARDIAECSDDDVDEGAIDEGSDNEHSHSRFMYRRASGVAYGPSRPVLNDAAAEDSPLTAMERKRSRDAERSLLRDNHLLPPKHKRKNQSLPARMYRKLFSTKVPHESREGNERHQPTETSPLLAGETPSPASTNSDDVEEQWEEAVISGRIRTTWQRETKTIVQYSIPLIVTFVLQYSINVASIFAVGRIGKIELGAVSCKLFLPFLLCLIVLLTMLARWPTCLKPSPVSRHFRA